MDKRARTRDQVIALVRKAGREGLTEREIFQRCRGYRLLRLVEQHEILINAGFYIQRSESKNGHFRRAWTAPSINVDKS